MDHYYQAFQKIAQDAAMYDLLANYYKYLDPQKHMYYYQLHFMCMKQLSQMQLIGPRNYNNAETRTARLAKVRILHISPDTPKVDIYVNGEKTLENITYYQISPYLEVPAGSYKIDVYRAGQKTNPLLSKTVELEGNKSYTVAAAGRLANLSLVAIVDETKFPPKKALVRFWHLSPNAPSVDIAVKDGEVLFRNVSFSEGVDYLEVDPGTVTLEVRLAGTEDVVLTLRDQHLQANKAYTITAIGLVGGSPRLEALMLQP